MNIYKVSQLLLDTIASNILVDEETGEVYENEEAVNMAFASFDDKLDAYVHVIHEKKAEIFARKERIESMKEMNEKLEKEVQALEKAVIHALDLCGGKRKTMYNSISTRKSKYVSVFDSEKIPMEFMKAKTTLEPDKNLIKEALKAGRAVEGAELKERTGVTIK